MSLFLYGLEALALTPFFREPIVLAIQLITSHHFNFISDVIKKRERDLFNRITSDTSCVLYDLLPPKRNRALRERGHDFILSGEEKEQLKRDIVNRCLFKLLLSIFQLKSFSKLQYT